MLYNSGFEQLMHTRLGAKFMPSSIFKMANEEDDSGKKLQDLVEEQLKRPAAGGQIKEKVAGHFYESKLSKIEITLIKQQYKLKSQSPLIVNGKKSPGEVRKEMEETKSTIDKAVFQKDMFESKQQRINCDLQNLRWQT